MIAYGIFSPGKVFEDKTYRLAYRDFLVRYFEMFVDFSCFSGAYKDEDDGGHFDLVLHLPMIHLLLLLVHHAVVLLQGRGQD